MTSRSLDKLHRGKLAELPSWTEKRDADLREITGEQGESLL